MKIVKTDYYKITSDFNTEFLCTRDEALELLKQLQDVLQVAPICNSATNYSNFTYEQLKTSTKFKKDFLEWLDRPVILREFLKSYNIEHTWPKNALDKFIRRNVFSAMDVANHFKLSISTNSVSLILPELPNWTRDYDKPEYKTERLGVLRAWYLRKNHPEPFSFL